MLGACNHTQVFVSGMSAAVPSRHRHLSHTSAQASLMSKRRISEVDCEAIRSYKDLREKIDTLPVNPYYISPAVEAVYELPLAFHVELYGAVWKALNVYGSAGIVMGNEARKVKVFEAYLVPIINLFEGRIMITPEAGTEETTISSSDAVIHKFYVLKGIVLILVILTGDVVQQNDTVQLLIEMISAAKNNAYIPGFENLQVRGILTDLGHFYFYSFDPVTETFFRSKLMRSNVKRRDFLKEMIPIVNKVFSVVFRTYIEALPCTSVVSDLHASTSNWEQALYHVQQACALFEECCQTVKERDAKSTEAISHLRQSVLNMPRPMIEGNLDLNENSLKKEALEVVLDMYHTMLD